MCIVQDALSIMYCISSKMIRHLFQNWIPGFLNGITGEYATPEGYFVDEKKAEEFDKMFPYKEKI